MAAVSVGVVEGEERLDLAYAGGPGRRAWTRTSSCWSRTEFVEVQGTGEHGTFSRAQLDTLLDLAERGIAELFQRPAEGARLVKLLAATRSGGKQREIRRILEPAGLEVVFPDDSGFASRDGAMRSSWPTPSRATPAGRRSTSPA